MDQFVTIKTFTYPHQSYMVRGKLESEGIQTFLKDENTVNACNFYSNAIGGVKLQVFAKDAERALNIINITESVVEEMVILSSNDITDKTKCPFCKSTNIKQMTYGNWLTFLPFLIIGFIIPVYKHSNLCFDCGKRWRIK